ncbi:MAG: GNAT family N-acetyltransferase [Candidatus Eisenbacteria bacterium]|nr:GNAT family N-acetyltransferase [Candidatus Eisenbacteria bacterium]
MSERAAAVLDHVPAGWDALLEADPSASPAHRPILWQAFAGALPGFSWRVLAHLENGRLVGGAPLMRTQRGPWRELHALPMMLPGVPLALPGAHARVDAALAPAFEQFAASEQVAGGTWALYRPEGPAPEPAAFAVVAGGVREVETAVLPLTEGLEARRARIARKQRQALDQAMALPYTYAEEPLALGEAYALHAAQSKQWPGHRPLPLELYTGLLRARDAHGAVARLHTLRSAAGLASATFTLEGAHETFLWWAGTHPRARRSSAFLRLVWEIALRAHAEGRRRVNLGASLGLPFVAAFKQSLGAEGFTYPVRVLDARHAPGWLQALARFKRGGLS